MKQLLFIYLFVQLLFIIFSNFHKQNTEGGIDLKVIGNSVSSILAKKIPISPVQGNAL